MLRQCEVEETEIVWMGGFSMRVISQGFWSVLPANANFMFAIPNRCAKAARQIHGTNLNSRYKISQCHAWRGTNVTNKPQAKAWLPFLYSNKHHHHHHSCAAVQCTKHQILFLFPHRHSRRPVFHRCVMYSRIPRNRSRRHFWCEQEGVPIFLYVCRGVAAG